jgi:hypothetical protein
MSGGGFILGGLLSGLGAGIVQDAAQQREAAMEKLRQQFARDSEDRGEQRLIRAETRKEGYDVRADQRRLGSDLTKLREGGKIQSEQDRIKLAHDVALENLRTGNQIKVETVRSSLRRAETKEEIALRDSLDAGDYSSVVVGGDGSYYGVTERGLVPTGVPAAASAAEVKVSAEDADAAYADARSAWVRGGREGEPPKRTDFTASGSSGGGRYAPTVTPKAPPSTGQQAQALAELGQIYPNATPERYPQLFRDGKKIPAEEAAAIVRRRYPQ